MEREAFSAFGNLPDCVMELDFVDELLYEGCWLETTDAFNLVGSSRSASSSFNDTSSYLPFDTDQTSYASAQRNLLEETEADFRGYPPSVRSGIVKCAESQSMGIKPTDNWQPESSKFNTTWWIGPKSNPGPSSSVKQRLMQAVSHLKERMNDKNVLIQIWVPVKKGNRNVLTTNNQPFSLDPTCKSLEKYRYVSEAYQFPADEDTKESVGLPGRVFLGKVPEWTPDVRFFKSDEYPRVAHAQKCDVRGSLALPMFERGSGACLGVVEIVTTSRKCNYRMELESVCKALETVNLRSSESFNAPIVKDCNHSFQAALPQLLEVITYVCKAYKLPLALTWASCAQQGKEGCRHSSENYALCISTVDSACFVANQQFLDFHEACSEHHLLIGQGIVGKAFSTNKPCFATDITAFTKTEYPLSHHARIFGLCCAIAVPMVSIYTGSADFVLEFFLPTECKDAEEQNQLLNLLCMVGHQGHQISQFTTMKDLESATEGLPSSCTSESSSWKTSWIATMMEADKGSKGVSISFECQKELKREEFQLTNDWDSTQLEPQHGQCGPKILQVQQNSELKPNVEGNNDTFSFGRHSSVGSRKLAQKRCAKTEKTITLQVLRQYFAGSLKDAAKSIGVCPTTLKRICRQHGITRWPSRKIKKVHHSLKKIQHVIDSVQEAHGTIHLGSFYNSFPELSCPEALGSGTVSSSKPSDPSMRQKPRATTKSASSYSQSSSSTTCCSIGSKQQLTLANAPNYEDKLAFDSHGGGLKRTCSDTEMHVSTQEEPKPLARSLSDKLFDEHACVRLSSSSRNIRGGGIYRIKATFGEDKIRFRMQAGWGFSDLQSEIAKRFNILDVSKMDLKYLDDDREWVLLTCDADLEECMDVYKAFHDQTIQISVHHVSHPSKLNG